MSIHPSEPTITDPAQALTGADVLEQVAGIVEDTTEQARARVAQAQAKLRAQAEQAQRPRLGVLAGGVVAAGFVLVAAIRQR